MKFMDIYNTIDINLLENDYYNQDIIGKKTLIDKYLKEYAISKILEINKVKTIQIDENASINELVRLLSELIPQEKHFDTIRHFTHYILNVASNLQNFAIVWWVDGESDLIENPVADFNIEEKWESITTHEQTSYLKTFDFAYDTFRNKFMQKNYRQPTKHLIQ